MYSFCFDNFQTPILRLYLLHDWSTSSVPILAPVRSALHLFLDELLTFTGFKTDNLLRTIGPSHKGSGSVRRHNMIGLHVNQFVTSNQERVHAPYVSTINLFLKLVKE